MTTLDLPTQMEVALAITFRPARVDDIPKLEWYGQYIHFRNVFRKTYREQVKGNRLMLIAECNDFPIGQIFMQTGGDSRRKTYFYSLRVMDMFRGRGIGSRLLEEAENIAVTYGYTSATIAAAKDNPRARQLYERHGYLLIGEDSGRWSYIDHEGKTRYVYEPCWVLEKAFILR